MGNTVGWHIAAEQALDKTPFAILCEISKRHRADKSEQQRERRIERLHDNPVVELVECVDEIGEEIENGQSRSGKQPNMRKRSAREQRHQEDHRDLN